MTSLFLELLPTAVAPKVWTRANWADDWAWWQNVVAVSCTETLGRSIGEAQLSHEYGWRVNFDSAARHKVNEVNLLDHWVMIEWEDFTIPNTDIDYPNRRWYGIITDDTTREGAVAYVNMPDGSSDWCGTGSQAITALSVEWVLTRKQILDCYVLRSPGSAAVLHNCAPAFNAARGDGVLTAAVGNQANVLDSNGKKTFDLRLSNARPWNAKEILDYLLHFFNPLAGSLTWNITGGAVNDLAAFVPVQVEQYGRTLFEIINSLIDSRRGLVWSTRINDSTNTIDLIVDSVATSAISVTGTSFTLAANNKQIELAIDNPAALRVIRTRSVQRQYEQIIAEGGRLGFVATYGVNQYERDWTDQDLIDYSNGASGAAGYSALSLEDKKTRNDTIRTHDPRLARVFTAFKINRTAGDYLIPRYNRLGNELGVDRQTWEGGMRVEPYLPFVEGWDYSGATPTPGGASSVPQLLRPLAVMRVGGKWIEGAKLASAARSESLFGGIAFGVEVVPTDSIGGFAVVPSAPSHVLGATSSTTNPGVNVFDPQASAPSDYDPQLCWSDTAVTLYVTSEERLRIWHPEPAGASRHDVTSALVIRYGDRARYDVAKSAVYRVDGGTKYETNANCVIRDDRPFLRVVVEAAWRWYLTPRRAVELEIAGLRTELRLGQLMTQIQGTIGVHSIVSSIRWDFLSQTTAVATEFVDLDFGAI